VNLDLPAFLRAHDPRDMLGTVVRSPLAWSDGFARARGTQLPAFCPFDAVCVCGMGGSGISGDVLAAFAATRSKIPVVVIKGFSLPAWVGANTLVICVSYSGGTEETLACFDAARHAGAQVAVVAGGGDLGERADEQGVPRLDPGSGLMPRAALPELASAALVIGERAGLFDDLKEEEDALYEVLATNSWGPDVPGEDNEAKKIAQAIETPQIWGQEGMLAVAAQRWKCQLNENSKMDASFAVVPESLHNEIVPFAAAVVLRSSTEPEPIARRLNALAAQYSAIIETTIPGETDLALFASAALLGDFVSVYCAALAGVDPTPIEAIARLKGSLG